MAPLLGVDLENPCTLLVNFTLKSNCYVPHPGKPLFLTPLIQAGNISQAQKLAYVQPEALGLKDPVESYSGYLTVGNPKCDSNLFFWFFPAMVSTLQILGLLFKPLALFKPHLHYSFLMEPLKVD